MEVQVFLAAPNKMKRRNPKIIALIIEITLFVIWLTITLILDANKTPINIMVVAIVFGVIVFAIILTLSLIRYDVMREIRNNFYDTNLPLYTDNTALMGHDIKDEEEKRKKE